MKAFDFASVTNARTVPVGGEATPDTAPNQTTLHVPNTFYVRCGKRVCDTLLAVVLLRLLTPIILIVWPLPRMDGGPGFYKQKRVGLSDEIFDYHKVRTMVTDAERALKELCGKDLEAAEEWAKNQKLANGPRIAKAGRFLRATSLDELPQIWNVLRGAMSFIGPRPFMTSQEHLLPCR